jgi:5-oxopent-3-ene-1,2,5-tricarboxylate decarboxylase/2-hydroxyhepta-2,4-diene-1,7-dioate isomerase
VRRARVRHAGGEFDAVVGDDGSLVTEDGRELDPSEVVWLPPRHGVVIGLALNYRAHAAELDFKKHPDHPILFVKNPSSIVGHRHPIVRPDGVKFMHYEGELGVVIGKRARGVRRADAMQSVGGYTVCNDVTVRDFIENFFRPPVKAKGFDTFGPIGPWVVDAAQVPDPHALGVRTFVNGELRQEGSTEDLIFDIPTIIEFITEFMTLSPGDIISTGTPRGISDIVPGDDVVVEVDGVGRLENRVVSVAEFAKAGR